MKAFIGRFGAPSLRWPGVVCCRVGTSGVGETEGVARVTVSSLAEGESERTRARSDSAAAERRADRRISRLRIVGDSSGRLPIGKCRLAG